MHLARHQISTIAPVQILDAHFDADSRIFTACTPEGFAVYRVWPLQLLRKREFTGGTLRTVLPLHQTSLLFLLGGGASPLYPRNKVILWDDALGRVVAELEFRNEVCNIACRRGMLAVALKRRVVLFDVMEGEGGVRRVCEWDTCENKGLVALASAPGSTLLAIAGHRTGHIQLIHLSPCPGPPNTPTPISKQRSSRRPHSQSASFIMAHTSGVTSLSVLPSGRLLATTSPQGTLIRIWDTHTGKLQNELRRGTDKAEIYGVAFTPDEKEVAVWSDKGTVHVFSLVGGSSSNKQSKLSPLTPYISLPKYFGSEWSYAQFRIPSQSSHIALSAASKSSSVIPDERCTVTWIKYPLDSSNHTDTTSNLPYTPQAPPDPTSYEYQLIVLTYTGGWYRVALPKSASQSQSRSSTPQPPNPRSTHTIGGAASTIAPTSPRMGMHKILSTPSTAAFSQPGLSTRHGHSRHLSSPTVGRLGTSIADRSRAETVVGAGRHVLQHQQLKDKGKGKEREKVEGVKSEGVCTLEEFRRYGRWDGWA